MIIIIEGGLVQDILEKDDKQVIVRDYDTDGIPNEELKTDRDGYRYRESIW